MEVLTFPHPLLRQKAKAVERFDEALARLAGDLLETMYREGGIGLAAPQVGVLQRLLVIDLGAGAEDPAERRPQVIVNPRIAAAEGEVVTEEGCLSVPEFTAEIKRAERIELVCRDVRGAERRETLEGLAAVCVQHEMDHLDGRLFIDRLPPMKRQMVKKRLIKQARTA